METSATTTASQPAFHSGDFEQVAEFRTVSSLAIVSLVFGLAAPLCFVMPLLMAIPFFGAAISIVALRRIAASDGALAGSWAAAAGLVLCVGSAAAAISHSQVTRYLRTRQAEDCAREWLANLLAGKVDQAFQGTVEGLRPAAPPEPGAPTPSETPREHFGNHPLVAALVAAGPDSSVRFQATLSYEAPTSGQMFVGQQFTVSPAKPTGTKDGSKNVPFDVVLTLQRSRVPGQSGSRWLVLAYKAPGLGANAASH